MTFQYEVRCDGYLEGVYPTSTQADRRAAEIRRQHEALRGVVPDVRVTATTRPSRSTTLEVYQ